MENSGMHDGGHLSHNCFDALAILRWEDDGGPVRSEDTEPAPPPCAAPAAMCPETWCRAARTAHALLLTEGGGTVNPLTGESIGPVDEYCVGLGGMGQVLKHLPLPCELLAYMLDHSNILGTLITIGAVSSRVYLGVWFNKEAKDWSIDCTVRIADYKVAETFARANIQWSIYKPLGEVTVWIDYDQGTQTDRKAA